MKEKTKKKALKENQTRSELWLDLPKMLTYKEAGYNSGTIKQDASGIKK